jgi:hypothetical protein
MPHDPPRRVTQEAPGRDAIVAERRFHSPPRFAWTVELQQRDRDQRSGVRVGLEIGRPVQQIQRRFVIAAVQQQEAAVNRSKGCGIFRFAPPSPIDMTQRDVDSATTQRVSNRTQSPALVDQLQ